MKQQLAPADAEIGVKTAPHVRLADALMAALKSDAAADALAAHRQENPHSFWCVRCQVDIETGTFRPDADFTAWPCAEILDSVRWRCRGACRRTGTRWELERRVLESLPALNRLLGLDR